MILTNPGIDPDPKTVAVRMAALAKEGLTAESFGLSEHQLRHHLDPCNEPELFELVKMDPVVRNRLWEWLSAEHKAAAPRPNGHATPFFNGQANDEAKPLPELRIFNPADWEGKQAPTRRWDVQDYIHHGSPALLYADGGTGKGYLGLQLAIARAVEKEWIGLMPGPGRTLVLSTEDDLDEMWRRIEGMLPFFGARMADLGDIRLIDLVGENSVLGLLNKGIIEPTPMYRSMLT